MSGSVSNLWSSHDGMAIPKQKRSSQPKGARSVDEGRRVFPNTLLTASGRMGEGRFVVGRGAPRES